MRFVPHRFYGGCGSQPLLATAIRDDFELDDCRPGQEVTLNYRPDAII